MKGMYLNSNYNRWMHDTAGEAKTACATGCNTLHHPSQPSAPLLEGQGSHIQPEQHILGKVPQTPRTLVSADSSSLLNGINPAQQRH